MQSAVIHQTDRDRLDRVRRHTNGPGRHRIDQKSGENVRRTAASANLGTIGRRISELEREWDVERTLEANAATLALTGAIAGTTVSKKWFWLTGGVLAFLFQHATSGWCPPLPILRRFGVRTQGEIDQEKYALKAIRGDFGRQREDKPGTDEILLSVSEMESAKTGREPDRVRRYTTRNQQQWLDEAMATRVRFYAARPREVISERIRELYREWSIERYLQVNVAVVGLTSTALAVGRNRKWGYVACAGLAAFLFHAVEGFDPPIPLMRKAGIRTRSEIDREIYALKIIRGDFDTAIGATSDQQRINAALAAVELT